MADPFADAQIAALLDAFGNDGSATIPDALDQRIARLPDCPTIVDPSAEIPFPWL
jgi:hypothetical protein